jgi:hypothetical protein
MPIAIFTASVWMEDVSAWTMVIISVAIASTNGRAKHFEVTPVIFGQSGPMMMVMKYLPMNAQHIYTMVDSLYYKKMKHVF